MSDNKLQREFRGKDVQRMRNIITKNYGDKTAIQVGYRPYYVERTEGDEWEENNRKWTIKNGLKQTVTRLDRVKKLVVMPLCCPKCEKPMTKGRIDKYMYSIHQKCLDCVIEYETRLKIEGKFGQYAIDMQKQGVRYHIKEMEDVLLELMMNESNESFVTEAGDIEAWRGKGADKQQIVKDIQEYIQKLQTMVDA
jgi:hypothetical protein